MSHKRKLIPFLSLLLLLAGGLGMLMIERANAVCYPWPRCCWQGIVAGTVTVTNPKARITTDKLEKAGKFLDVDVSQELLDAFKAEKLLEKPTHGFIVLTEKKMTGFVPTTRSHGDEDKTIPPAHALKMYTDEFEKYVEESGMKDQKGKS